MCTKAKMQQKFTQLVHAASAITVGSEWPELDREEEQVVFKDMIAFCLADKEHD